MKRDLGVSESDLDHRKGNMSTGLQPIETHQAAVQTDGFGERSLEIRRETAAQAIAAREQAVVQARFIVALQRPRNGDQFRADLLKECQRPEFAEMAEYAKPVGKEFKDGKWVEKIARGPSIRLIETGIRCFKNIHQETTTVYDSPEMRICRVSTTDLESNVDYSTEVQVVKVVERRGSKGRNGEEEPPKGRTVLSERINSAGEKTYLVLATDDEVRVKQAALSSIALREQGRRILPGHVIQEAIANCRKVCADRDAKDPDAARRKLLDAFVQLGIQPADLHAFLGHSTERLAPKEIEDLRQVYAAVRDGEATWDEVMEARNPAGTVEEAAQVAERKIASFKRSEAAKDTSKQANGGGQGETAQDAHPAGTEREIPASTAPALTPEENRRLDEQIVGEERAKAEQTEQPARRGFGRRQ